MRRLNYGRSRDVGPTEASEIFGVSLGTIRNWAIRRLLPAKRTLSGRLWFLRTDIMALREKMLASPHPLLKGEMRPRARPKRIKGLSIGGAAALLDVSTSTARRWAESGLIPGRRVLSGHWRFDRDEIGALAGVITWPPQPAEAFGASEIRALRRGEGLTQQQFADAAGVSLNMLGRWERGEWKPSKRHRADLMRFKELLATPPVVPPPPAPKPPTRLVGTVNLADLVEMPNASPS